MLSIQERLALHTEPIEGALWQWACMLRCATPGIVKSFDPVRQTCVVQPAIQEIFLLPPPATPQNLSPGSSQNIPTSVTLKPVEDVHPIMFRGGGFAATVPITEGTPCLLISADSSIDGWWQTGSVSAQYDRRRHDLSDSFALFGPWSYPSNIIDYSTTSMQLRTDDGSVVIDIANSAIKVQAPLITAISEGGAAQPVMTQDFFEWYITNIQPFLVSKGYTGPMAPTTSTTTVFEAE